jgi:Fe-S cluster assembly protein SufD
VQKGAQKTSAEQENNNLLLSGQALANSTPQLEIFADDVQCRHGSTIGQIDDLPLFYVRSRGIGEADARRIMTFAFVNEIIQRISIPSLRDRLAERLTRLAPPSEGHAS